MLPKTADAVPRLRGFALAAALILPAAPLRAVSTSCGKDINLYCQDAPADSQIACLLDNWGRISPPCREALIDPRDACRELIFTICRDAGPLASIANCLSDHLEEASPACKQEYESAAEKNPCLAPKQQFCKDAKGGEATVRCLSGHSEELPFECLTKLTWSPYWVRQCKREKDELCPETKSKTQTTSCLAKKLDQLSPWCRKAVKRRQLADECASEIASICKDPSRGEARACLLAHQDKLSKRCLTTLRDWKAAPAAVPGLQKP